MLEVLESAVSPYNLAYTILMALIALYWVAVILGGLDLDLLDVDVDADPGGDLDVDGGIDGGFTWLGFFNMDAVPIVFFFSIAALLMWVVSISLNHWLDLAGPSWAEGRRGLIAAVLAVPNLIFAMFFAKILLIPAKRYRERPSHTTPLTGKTCVVTSLQVTENEGRCEMAKRDGSLILHARTRNGEVLRKGDPALVLEEVQDERGTHFVVTLQTWEENA